MTVSLLTAVFSCSLQADDGTPILGKSGIGENWKVQAWGGLDTSFSSTMKKGDFTALEVAIKKDTVPYAGLSLQTDAGVPLTDDLRKTGVVTISIKNGKSSSGDPGVGQDVQYALSFLDASGKPLHSPFTPVTLATATADSDASSWQKIKISIPEQLAKLPTPTDAVSLGWVRVQFVGPPAAGIYLADCSISK